MRSWIRPDLTSQHRPTLQALIKAGATDILESLEHKHLFDARFQGKRFLIVRHTFCCWHGRWEDGSTWSAPHSAPLQQGCVGDFVSSDAEVRTYERLHRLLEYYI